MYFLFEIAIEIVCVCIAHAERIENDDLIAARH